MGLPKGTKLVRESKTVLTKRILDRCLDLQDRGIVPSVTNIEPVGCSRVTLCRIRDDLIRDGLVVLPRRGMYNHVYKRLVENLDNLGPEPDEDEEREIGRRIEEMRRLKYIHAENQDKRQS